MTTILRDAGLQGIQKQSARLFWAGRIQLHINERAFLLEQPAFWGHDDIAVTQHRANGLTRDGDADGMFEIVALTGPRAVAA